MRRMSLIKAIEMAGSQSALGRAIGEPQQQIWKWLNPPVNSRVPPGQVPPDRCPAIERATDGSVTCEELRPDVRWQRVPDPAWPHPDGRPCIDVAAPAVQQEVRDAA